MASFLPLELRCRGRKVAALRTGNGPRRLLALHGWLDNAHSFAPLAPLLRGVELVAVDLPGHGRSEHRSGDASYDFLAWVGDVLELADELEWKRFVLMGHSMGAGIASLVAGVAPERLEALILLDGLGPLAGDPAEGPARLRHHQQQLRRLRQSQAPVHADMGALVRRMQAAVPLLSAASAALLLQRGAVAQPTAALPQGVATSYDGRLRATSAARLSEAQVVAFLQAIVAPTLLVRPRQGAPYAGIQLEGRLQAVAGLQTASVPGGHHAHMDEPAPIAAAIDAFLRPLPT